MKQEKDIEIDFEEDERLTKDIIEEEIEEQKKRQGTSYNEIIESMPELKEDLDYILIANKIKEGKNVSEKEKQFVRIYEEAKSKEVDFQESTYKKMEEEKGRQEQIQDKINQEYEEYKTKYPDKIEKVDAIKTLTPNNTNNFLKVGLAWAKLAKGKKKGGKIFVKVSRPKNVSFEWTNKDIRFVEFWSTNERGDKVKEITRVSQYNYTFNGTSIPVIFAIQGFAESWDFYSEFKKNLDSEFVSGLVMEAYNLGYKDGTLLLDKNKKPNTLQELMPILIVVILVIMGAVAYLCYAIYEDNTKILDALETIKQVGTTTAPLVVGP